MKRTKRKNLDMSADEECHIETPRIRPRLKLENVPPANSIHDLIEIGNSIRFYKNLDTIMLWKITPYLEQLDKMIGMKKLKESVFYK